ncbi:Thymidylate kinase [Candidatus Magnetobacterium bavaricum]|uniref:Thymidylate kinase n=1 Tax=Candidatus Magnetobacterium bavaricum TaxID=29290 RepID=A0A0F3GWD3_9BACT|nr:Thymidylate kinase [Candidatus Magnetobacterium bavaricum]
MATFEPGATQIGARIRQLLLDIRLTSMAPLTELLLFSAQRVQHIEEIIAPALQSNKTVLVDRFTDSTIAYQGFGRGLDISLIEALQRLTNRLTPEMTFLLDIDVAEGLRRIAALNKTDRMESESPDFYERVRGGVPGDCRQGASEGCTPAIIEARRGTHRCHHGDDHRKATAIEKNQQAEASYDECNSSPP